MSDTSLSELLTDGWIDCDWEHSFGRFVQQWSIREQVSTAFKEATAAFAAQFTQPDGPKYIDACDRLAKFLDLKIPLEQSEQKLLVQVLQIGCAMHENALNNAMLTKSQQSAFRLANASLIKLCETALDGNVTYTDLWCEVFSLCCAAKMPLVKDLAKYLGNTNDDCSVGTSAAPSPVPTASGPATPRASSHDTTDVGQTTKFKEKVIATPNDRPSNGPPLGRRHTMPALSQSQSTSSRTGRTPSKASRRRGLEALQDIEE